MDDSLRSLGDHAADLAPIYAAFVAGLYLTSFAWKWARRVLSSGAGADRRADGNDVPEYPGDDAELRADADRWDLYAPDRDATGVLEPDHDDRGLWDDGDAVRGAAGLDHSVRAGDRPRHPHAPLCGRPRGTTPATLTVPR